MDICFFKEKTSALINKINAETVVLGYKQNNTLFIFAASSKSADKEKKLEGLFLYPIDSIEKYTFDKGVPTTFTDLLNNENFNSSFALARTTLPRNFIGYPLNSELAVFIYNKTKFPLLDSETDQIIKDITSPIINTSNIYSFIKDYLKFNFGKKFSEFIEETSTPMIMLHNISTIIYSNKAGLSYIENSNIPAICEDVLRCKTSDGKPLCDNCPLPDIILGRRKKELKNILVGINDKPMNLEIIPSEQNIGDALIIFKEPSQQIASNDEELITNISHELKTPLSAIIGSVQILKNNITENYASDPVITRFIDMIEQSAERLNSVLSAILHYDKSYSFGGLKKEKFDAAKEIKEIARAFLPSLKKKHLKVSLRKAPKDKLILNMEKYAFRQIFMQIIDNSIKFSNENSTITIHYGNTKLIDGKWFYVFQIQDTGKGIPEDILPYIFDRFTRSDQEVHTLTGTGMGLAIVKELLDTVGGKIDIKSREKEGTIVTVFLPSAE